MVHSQGGACQLPLTPPVPPPQQRPQALMLTHPSHLSLTQARVWAWGAGALLTCQNAWRAGPGVGGRHQLIISGQLRGARALSLLPETLPSAGHLWCDIHPAACNGDLCHPYSLLPKIYNPSPHSCSQVPATLCNLPWDSNPFGPIPGNWEVNVRGEHVTLLNAHCINSIKCHTVLLGVLCPEEREGTHFSFPASQARLCPTLLSGTLVPPTRPTEGGSRDRWRDRPGGKAGSVGTSWNPPPLATGSAHLPGTNRPV